MGYQTIDIQKNHMLAPRDYERDCGGSHQCVVCGDYFHAGEIMELADGDEVCKDCELDYYTSYSPAYRLPFALRHIDEAAGMWFYGTDAGYAKGEPWLQKEEKKELLRRMFVFAVLNSLYDIDNFLDDFCRGHDEFRDYVEGALGHRGVSRAG